MNVVDKLIRKHIMNPAAREQLRNAIQREHDLAIVSEHQRMDEDLRRLRDDYYTLLLENKSLKLRLQEYEKGAA